MAVIRAVISDDNIIKSKFLLAGEVVSLVTAMASLPIIAIFFWQRLLQARHTSLTLASCSLLVTYVANFFFVFVLTVVIHIRAETQSLCEASILICLTLYVVSKMAAFIFLIERAYIISWPVTPRYKTPEYILSCIGIFAPYVAVSALSIKYHIAMVNEARVCIIGIQMYALVPLLLVEVLSYLYLTIRFLVPLVTVHFGGQGLLLPLRRVVIRTCVGTGITMMSTLAVKVSLTMFNGEPAWLCCMTCKIDALIACAILHWITMPEAQDDGEHGTPQALGIGFDKESATVVATSQSSSLNRAPSDAPHFGLKEVL
ncbi:hypothetical protein Slin15195_G106510 [Septoria linicola]|uniref:Uncharacterized protein n=1 Tax=Septoria linicola TaxID=215465 RepID=A0A9Q9EP56_9PEZI|nr:hypothetical protein Slin14017_G069480 [Septoria linicola]USW57332.1 hypothetical protein Slin15195_G106510 [Septoria linicola]